MRNCLANGWTLKKTLLYILECRFWTLFFTPCHFQVAWMEIPDNYPLLFGCSKQIGRHYLINWLSLAVPLRSLANSELNPDKPSYGLLVSDLPGGAEWKIWFLAINRSSKMQQLDLYIYIYLKAKISCLIEFLKQRNWKLKTPFKLADRSSSWRCRSDSLDFLQF